MGNTCKSNPDGGSSTFCCGSGCGTDNGEENWDPSDLKPFQRTDLPLNQLSRYDQFYRFTGMPFIRMGIKEFMRDLDAMGDKI